MWGSAIQADAQARGSTRCARERSGLSPARRRTALPASTPDGPHRSCRRPGHSAMASPPCSCVEVLPARARCRQPDHPERWALPGTGRRRAAVWCSSPRRRLTVGVGRGRAVRSLARAGSPSVASADFRAAWIPAAQRVATALAWMGEWGGLRSVVGGRSLLVLCERLSPGVVAPACRQKQRCGLDRSTRSLSRPVENAPLCAGRKFTACLDLFGDARARAGRA